MHFLHTLDFAKRLGVRLQIGFIENTYVHSWANTLCIIYVYCQLRLQLTWRVEFWNFLTYVRAILT